jgi:hypothetical protein
VSVQLNHTIVEAEHRDETAAFLVDILGLEPAGTFGPFRVVTLGNDVSLDVAQASGPVHPQHYAQPGDHHSALRRLSPWTSAAS